jgi:hypothetical protein
VVKLYSTGDLEWQKTVGGDGDDQLLTIQLTPDGGYMFGGSSYSGVSGDKTDHLMVPMIIGLLNWVCTPVTWFADGMVMDLA